MSLDDAVNKILYFETKSDISNYSESTSTVFLPQM